jgi:hypothetical protein
MNKETIEALEYKLEIAEYEASNEDDDGFWKRLIEDIKKVLAEKNLKGHKPAADELYNYLDCWDMTGKEERAIFEDLARAGFADIYEPEAVYSQRPKTRLVDGIKYVVG